MSLSINKILVAGTATNTPSGYFQPVDLGNATITVPAGEYYMIATANVTVELNTSSNLAAPAWVEVVPNNTSALFISDGTNIRANVLAGSPTITIYGIIEGENAPGTFNT